MDSPCLIYCHIFSSMKSILFHKSIFLSFVCVLFFVAAGTVYAVNYMAWDAECSPPGTPCRMTSGYFNTNSAGWNFNFSFYSAPKTSITTAVKHSGNSSLKLMPDGIGTNEHLGTENVYFRDYGIGAYPGTYLGSTLYRRWWMRIDPGFSWGPGNGNSPTIKWTRTASDAAAGFYTFYISEFGFNVAECDNTGYDALCYDNQNVLHGTNAWVIPYDWSAKADGQWHEYIIKMKINSSTSCSPPNCDSENKIYVDGQLIGQHNGFRMVPNNVNMVQYESFGPASPYFQLGNSSAYGGTWYLDDMSIDSTWNSSQYADPGGGGGDTTPPTGVAITVPTTGATVTGNQTVTATCTDNVAVANVQMLLDGNSLGSADASSPYSITWDSTSASNGSHTLSARCTDTSSNQTTSSTINVTVSNTDTTPPIVSCSAPTGVLAFGTTSTSMTCSTNESATCRFGLTAGVAYGSQPNTFTSTGGTTHAQTVAGLSNGQAYTRYVRCSDGQGNANTSDTTVFWSVAAASGANECTNWQSAHPSWLWCDDFESDTSASWIDRNGASTFLRSAGNGQSSSYSMRATYPATTGVANAGDFKITFGASPVTPKVNPADNTKYSEIYWRTYIKTSSNWLPGTGAKFTRATGFVASDWTQSFITHWWDSSTPGIMMVDPASGVCRGGLKPDGTTACTNNTVITSGWNDFNNLYWLGGDNGTLPVLGNARANTWQCIEGHTKLNTAGSANGVEELWVDGILEAQSTGLNLVGSYSTYGINIFSVENYMNGGTNQSQYRDWDNLVVATTRVGCTVGGGGDTTPPAAPTGLTVQ